MNSIFEVHTLILLIALGLIYLINSRITSKLFKWNWINGFYYGIVFFLILILNFFTQNSPLTYSNFLILGLSGFFGGITVLVISTVIAVASLFPFVDSFISVALLISSSLLGILCHYLSKVYNIRVHKYVFFSLFGLLLQLLVLTHQVLVYKASFLFDQPLIGIVYTLGYSCLTGLVCLTISRIGKQNVQDQARIMENNYKFLLDRVSGAVFKTDRFGRITYANSYLLNQLGQTLNEIKGKNVVGLIFSTTSNDENLMLSFIEDIQDQSFQHQFDAELVDKNGITQWYKWDCRIAEDVEDSQFFELLFTGIEITEQKNAEIAHYSLENRIKLLYEGLLDSYVRVGKNDQIVDFNKAFLDLTGYSAEDVVDLTYNQITPDKWHNFEKKIVENQVIPNGYSELYEKEYIRKDGTLVPVELRVYLVKDINDKFDGYWGIIRDLSLRKESERKLKELSEKNEESALLFKSLLNAIPDIIGVQNIDKSILLYNAAGYKMLGLKPCDVNGKKCYEMLGRELPCEVCASQLVLESNRPESVEKFIPEMNIWIDSRSYPVHDSEGNIKYIIEHLSDITTRKNNELALKKSEELYRNMVEKSSLAILFFDYRDKSLIFTNSNSAANQLLGIFPDTTVGKTILEAFPFFNKQDLLHGITNTALYGTDFNVEQLEVNGEKETYFFEINAFQSEPSKVVLLISDITYRIKDREELELSEQKFRTVITENPMVFFTFDKDGIFTLSEGQGLAKLGLKPGQVVGMSVFDFYKDFPDIINSARLSLKGESIKSPIKVGDLVYDTVFTPYFDQNNAVKSVLGVAYDITARVNAEIESEQKSEELERYFNNSLDLLCIADLKGNFHKINPEWGRLLGFKPEELIGTNFFDFIHPDDIEATKNSVNELINRGRVLNFMNRYRTKDDTYRWIEWRSFMDDQLIYAVARDITERKLAEERILENDKLLQEQNEEYLALNEEMQESNQKIREINEKLIAATERAQESDRLKSAFLANMSHEIRTPMNGIVGFCQLLKQTKNVDDQVAKYCDIISTSSTQLLSIINDIIDVSKIEAGQVTLSHNPVSINNVVEKTVSLFQAMAVQNNVKLNLVTLEESITILSDETKIAQVLSNLINNAIKFTKGGEVDVCFFESNQYINICVKDNGIGIAKENHKLIFDRFSQVEGANSSSMKGTGLGLSISKSLVELLGGDIWVESELGRGSVFAFTIPNIKAMNNTENGSIRESDSQKYDFNGAAILIAEDDHINMMLLRKALENANVKVLSANNGKEAVELVKSNSSIKAILMDIKMPVMDGIEATIAIKSLYPKLPIIAQTAYALPDERKSATQAGCDAYLTKPISIAILYKTLKQLI